MQNYLSLWGVFVAAILIVACLHMLSRLLVTRLYREAGFLFIALLVFIAFLLDRAAAIGIDTGVLLCVLGAWAVVPLMALYWGRASMKSKREAK